MSGKIQINEVRAKQAVIVPGMRYVLAGGLALVLIAFVVLMNVHL